MNFMHPTHMHPTVNPGNRRDVGERMALEMREETPQPYVYC